MKNVDDKDADDSASISLLTCIVPKYGTSTWLSSRIPEKKQTQNDPETVFMIVKHNWEVELPEQDLWSL